MWIIYAFFNFKGRNIRFRNIKFLIVFEELYVEKDGKINSYLLFIYLRQKEIAKSNFDSEFHGTRDFYHLI